MVVPLIVGAARISKATAKGVSKGVKRTKGNRAKGKSNISKHRELRQGMRQARRLSRKNEDKTESEGALKTLVGHPFDSRNKRSKRATDKLLGKGTLGSRKTKAFTRGIMTLGSVVYPLLLQIIFAVLVVVALAVKDSWWGWVDFFDTTLMMASISWLVATLLGTFTMFIAAFNMGKYLRKWNVVLVCILCFCANWAPVVQIIPWSAIWIGYIIKTEK